MAKKLEKKKKSFDELLKGWANPNKDDGSENLSDYVTFEQLEKVVNDVLLKRINEIEDKLKSNNETIESMNTFLGSDDDDDYDDEDLSKIERENNRFYNKYGGQ